MIGVLWGLGLHYAPFQQGILLLFRITFYPQIHSRLLRIVSTPDFAENLRQLVDPDPVKCDAAREFLLAMDEDGVEWLTGEFYSGVSSALGIALIAIIGEIGGWEALAFLRQVYAERELPREWQIAAARALLRNIDNLDTQEVAGVKRFLGS
jgi:hypothetical protein